MTNAKNNFKNADDVFKYFYSYIKEYGVNFGDTKALFNVGFYIKKPLEINITDTHRKWNKEYAEAEYQ